MDRGVALWAIRLALGVVGIVLTIASVRLLARVRAAANWPTAPRVGRPARPLAYLGTGAGLAAVAWAVGVVAASLARPGGGPLAPAGPRGWLIGVLAALLAVTVGTVAVARLLERAELGLLIRTPSALASAPGPEASASRAEASAPGGADRGPGGSAEYQPGSISGSRREPAIPPDGQPGWVYRDAAGEWYIAVRVGTGAARTGQVLVRLRDFALVPPGAVPVPLGLAGSVEIAVYPLAEPGEPVEGELMDQSTGS